MLNFHYL